MKTKKKKTLAQHVTMQNEDLFKHLQVLFYGAPWATRTPDQWFRRPLLYPSELMRQMLIIKNPPLRQVSPWSGWGESNPHNQLGRLEFYRWTTPAYGAEDEIRTRDVHLGKVTLYHWATPAYLLWQIVLLFGNSNGAGEGSRTHTP